MRNISIKKKRQSQWRRTTVSDLYDLDALLFVSHCDCLITVLSVVNPQITIARLRRHL